MKKPVEIIGGGLAGLALGVGLRRRDVPVVVREAGRVGRHRVCGEFVSGSGTRLLDRIGIAECLRDAVVLDEVAYHRFAESLAAVNLPEKALGISRVVLDARLARLFEELGGDLRQGEKVGDDPRAEGRIMASGRPLPSTGWIGLKAHVEGPLERGRLDIHLGAGAYVGVSSVAKGRANVCGMFARRALVGRSGPALIDYLNQSGLGALAERIQDCGILPDSHCAVPASAGDFRVRASPEVRVGDACAHIAPFTGNGLSMALESVDAALPHIEAYSRGALDWQEVARRVHQDQELRFRRRLRVSSIVRPFFLDRGPQAAFAHLMKRGLVPVRRLYPFLR